MISFQKEDQTLSSGSHHEWRVSTPNTFSSQDNPEVLFIFSSISSLREWRVSAPNTSSSRSLQTVILSCRPSQELTTSLIITFSAKQTFVPNLGRGPFFQCLFFLGVFCENRALHLFLEQTYPVHSDQKHPPVEGYVVHHIYIGERGEYPRLHHVLIINIKKKS